MTSFHHVSVRAVKAARGCGKVLFRPSPRSSSIQSVSGIANRAPDRRLLLLGAILGALVVVGAVVAISLSVGGGKKASEPPVKLAEASGVAAEFAGIPQRGLVLGSAKAPVTLVEYIDLQCPYCGAFERETFPTVVSKYVRTGKVRVEMRPLDFVGPDSVRGRNALFAAAQQNQAFPFVALLYANQGTENTGWLSDAMVRAAAASIPTADVAAITGAGSSDALSTRLEQQRAADGVTGVPTFFVRRTGEKTGGVKLVNPDAAALEAALRGA